MSSRSGGRDDADHGLWVGCEVCIVKRSDGNWKYGTLKEWDREYAVIVVNDAGAEKTYGQDNYSDVRRLDCESGSK